MLVDMIVEALNKADFIRAECFVGQQTKGSTKGLRQKDQIDLVQRFKSGEVNVLVATSVAEEGLDIAECDIVIFYDIVPSEIRSIQRRGRTGRKRESTVILLKAERDSGRRVFLGGKDAGTRNEKCLARNSQRTTTQI